MRLAAWAPVLLSASLGCRGEPARKVASDTAVPSAQTAAASPLTCGLERQTLLTGNGVGDLQVGASVSAIKQRCVVIADTTEFDDEANPQPVLLVRLGSDTVTAELVGGRVWRVVVESPRFHTADSLGVGSLIAAFRRFRDLKAVIGDGPYFLVTAKECGMSFGLSPNAVGDTLDLVDLEGPALSRLADTLAVQTVLMHGCNPR